MLLMEASRILIFFGDFQHRGFIKQVSIETDAHRISFIIEPIGNHHTGMPG